MTYERALDITLAEWRAMNPEAEAEPKAGSPKRQATIHGVIVPKGDRTKVLSVSATDGDRLSLKPLKLISTAEAPLATIRYYELENDPPLTDIYRQSGEEHQRYVDALSDVIGDVFSDSTRVNVELVTVPAGKRLREAHESRVRDGEFGVRFYMPAETDSWLKQHRGDLKKVSHEVFHAFDELASPPFTGTQQLKALNETAASLFSKCVELGADGRATIYGDPVPAAEWKIGFTDAQLTAVLNKDFETENLTRTERRFISEVFAWAIWLDYVGPRWEVPAGDPGAEKIKSLCTNETLADKEALLEVVRAIASDGKDAPVFDLES